MFWGFVAYGLIPLGLASCALLLSGHPRLESIGRNICSAGLQAGTVVIQLDKICVLIASVLFGLESFKAENTDLNQISVSLQDRARMNRWRHERNYWISLYMLTLWAVAWRVNYLIDVYRASGEGKSVSAVQIMRGMASEEKKAGKVD